MRKTPYSVQALGTGGALFSAMLSQLPCSVLRRVVGLSLASALFVVGAHAQVTVAGFTNSSGFQNLKIGTSNVTDLYDNGSVNTDVSKQSNLQGTNQKLDLVGNSSYSVIQVATGTVLVSSVATAAMEFRIRLADYNVTNFKNISSIILIQNGSTVFGVGLGLDASKNLTLAGVTSNAGTTFNAQYQYTVGTTISTDSARYSYTQADGAAVGGVGTDANLTFVVLASELSAISSGFTFGSTTGVSVFTNGGGSSLTSGNINMDFISSDGTATGSLAFGSTSGSLTPVPEFSTAMILGMALLPPIGVQLLRRRRRTNAASAAN